MNQLRTRDALIAREKRAGASDERRAIAVTASTDAVDSWGEIVDQSWDLTRFERNPIVLWQHDRCEPIGTAENVRVEDGALKATLVLAPPGVSADADKAWSLIEAGILRAVSVGFVPRDIRWEMRDGVDVAVLANNELREISIVSLPANPDAVIEARVKRAEARRQQPPAQPAKEPAMHEVIKSLGLPAGSSEQDAVAALERLYEALGAKSASEAHGRAIGLAAKAAAHDKLAAELEAAKAAEVKRERDEIIKSATDAGKLPPGADALRSQLETLPIETARAIVDALPVAVKTAPSVKASATASAPNLNAHEIKVAKSLGLTLEQFAAEKARRAALNLNAQEEV